MSIFTSIQLSVLVSTVKKSNYSRPEQIYELAKRHPKVPIIMGHMGGPEADDIEAAVNIIIDSADKNNAKLYLVGDFDINTQELLVNLEVARKLNIVREYDNLSSGQRASLMKGAIAAILPSKQDNLPIAHLDAMKCSCPVLTEKTPSVYEVCEDAVLYSDIDNMAEYCEILSKLEQDENYRKNYIYSGLYREKSYSWDKSAQEFLQNLEQLLV